MKVLKDKGKGGNMQKIIPRPGMVATGATKSKRIEY